MKDIEEDMVCPLNRKVKISQLLWGDEISSCLDKECDYNPKGFCEYHELIINGVPQSQKNIEGLAQYFEGKSIPQ